MLVDRNELEAQLFGNLEAVGFGHVEVAESKEHLRELLASDQRGLIVSMIHKFDDMPAKINTRTNIFVLVDEAHRTTGGDLGNYLMGALPNATYIGFTGTPIDRTAHGKGTFKVFGLDDEKGYLDKYSIRESIAGRHDRAAPLRAGAQRPAGGPRDAGEGVPRPGRGEGVSDIEELNQILEQAVKLRNMLKNRERVEKVAGFVAEHFRENVEPMGYKAFLVGWTGRRAASTRRRSTSTCRPSTRRWSSARPARRTRSTCKRHYLSEDAGEGGPQGVPQAGRAAEDPDRHREAAHRLRRADPLLHVPGQADAGPRAAPGHRPGEPALRGRRRTAEAVRLRAGFRGHLREAGEGAGVRLPGRGGVIEGVDVLQRAVRRADGEGAARVPADRRGKKGDKAAEAVLEHFRDKEKREEFYAFFQELEDIYEILSPDAFLRPFLDDYDELLRMFQLVRAAYDRGKPWTRSSCARPPSWCRSTRRSRGSKTRRSSTP